MVLLKTISILYHRTNKVNGVFPPIVKNLGGECSGRNQMKNVLKFAKFCDFCKRKKRLCSGKNLSKNRIFEKNKSDFFVKITGVE